MNGEKTVRAPDDAVGMGQWAREVGAGRVGAGEEQGDKRAEKERGGLSCEGVQCCGWTIKDARTQCASRYAPLTNTPCCSDSRRAFMMHSWCAIDDMDKTMYGFVLVSSRV